ncbi:MULTISPECIES: hypothetical protein [unclassified Colwellia]|uniref:hypothetical protein n=1 Tax=unclassified Colwellia TaxID=196834 RepID=UPI002175218D|nr:MULTISPECIES: hypothetical protein [unclassified Colwellia]
MLINLSPSLVILAALTALSVKAETPQASAVRAEAVVARSVLDTKAVKVDETSFSCIREMTPVRHFYIDNLLGDIKSTLAAANAPEGAVYPPGSVVQLVPTEVMVKRESGTSPATGDWEFFELEVNENGSTIAKRGFVDVVNRFDGNCFACHVPARDPWDFICESGHGCEPIPIDHKMTGALQRSDPRCGNAVPEDGDWMALFKLKSMVTIGLTKKWFEEKF